MSEAIFGVIGTIIGTIWGFVLSEWATRQREERTEKRQAGAIRTMLRLEISQNLASLRDFWGKVNQVDESEQDPDLARLRLARRMIESPLPHWSHRMWESQMSLLTIGLSEEEIKQVHDLHNRLDAITRVGQGLAGYEVITSLLRSNVTKLRLIWGGDWRRFSWLRGDYELATFKRNQVTPGLGWRNAIPSGIAKMRLDHSAGSSGSASGGCPAFFWRTRRKPRKLIST